MIFAAGRSPNVDMSTAGALALAASVRRSGLGEHVAVIAERRRLGAALVLEVLQPLRRQLAKCHTVLAALSLARFDFALLPIMLGDTSDELG